MSTDEIITQQTGPNQVVHQRQDSTQELNNLFETALKNPNQQSSWSNRNLPETFFQPTSRHSRDNSIDGTQVDQPVPHNPFHIRTNSCPAVPSQPTSAPMRPSHRRTGSLEMIVDEHIPLPAGWEAAFTPDGKRYFIDHNTKSTSWVDPRKQYLSQLRAPSHSPLQQTIGDLLNSPLPQGWERAVGANNEVYFINHEARSTSWYDPRIPQHLQYPGGRLREGVNLSTVITPPGPQSPALSQTSPHQLSPMGGHQRMPSNEALAGPPTVHQRMPSGGSGDIPATRMQSADYQNQMLMRQSMMRQQAMSPEGMDMQSQHSPGDPFIGSDGGNNLHTKQESGDSGLGGMGNTFSLTRSSTDEFMDDSMDDRNSKLSQQQQRAGSGLHAAQMNTMNNNNNQMDANTDDLVPSLPADIGSDILNDVLNTKMDLTWL